MGHFLFWKPASAEGSTVTAENGRRIVRIVFSDTGRGLWHDAQLLDQVIRDAGLEPELVVLEARSEARLKRQYWLERLKSRLPAPICSYLNRLQCWMLGVKTASGTVLTIHLENIFPRYIAGQHRNWLVPNPEWFRAEYLHYLPFFGGIVCKTQDAANRFQPHHSRVLYSGFSGLPAAAPLRPRDEKSFRRFLHVAGNNRKKGTAAIVALWARHPEWPVLDIVIEDRERLSVIPENVRIHEQVDEAALHRLRAECGVVLAPSEAEGFGHVLLEGMAWNAVVVTVDAPPMNELVARDRGYLAGWTHSRPCRMGERYFVDPFSLEKVIQEILYADEEELTSRAIRARVWVENNHKDFRARFIQYLSQETIT